MDIRIRNAKPKDIDPIFKLWVESMKFHEGLDPVFFGFDIEKADGGKKFIIEQSKKDSTIMLVAEKDDKILGYLLGEVRNRLPFQKLQMIGYIFDIVVQEKERNKGIGGLLLDNALDFFRGRAVDTIMLSVSEKNTSAISFYKKHKFTTYLHSMVRENL